MYFVSYFKLFFFFKQKTAYEMRISDWSSDACSSDLTKMLCPFCTRAKKLLASKGASFEESDITMGGPKRAEMLQRAPGSATVPQVFINDRHNGGSDALAALDASGGLDPLPLGRASWRESVCQYVLISVVAVSLKKKYNKT